MILTRNIREPNSLLQTYFKNELGSKMDNLPLFISPLSFCQRVAVRKEGVKRESKECVSGCESRMRKEKKLSQI
jgi:hypothetical protein